MEPPQINMFGTGIVINWHILTSPESPPEESPPELELLMGDWCVKSPLYPPRIPPRWYLCWNSHLNVMFDNYDKFYAPKFTPSGLCDFSRKMFILTSHNFCFHFHSQPLYCKCFSVHFQNLILNLVFQFHCRRMHVNLANTMSKKFLTLNNPFRNLDPRQSF